MGKSAYGRSLVLLIAAVTAAFVSVTQQGFLYGVMNNVFHIPLVLRWAEDPIFANDPVVQSLKDFTSTVWLGIRLISNERNVEWVFYLAHFLTRAGAVAALTWASSSMGVRGLVPGILLMFWYGTAPALRWDTPIGAGEVFLFYFSHSELAIPLTVVAITLAVERKYLLAFASLGAIAHVNAFAAAWAGWALLGVAAGDKDLRKTVTKSIAGLTVAAVLALPVAVWILGVIQDHPVSAAEHERFLREYFPTHSLLVGQGPARVALFGTIAMSGLIAFKLLENDARAWLRAMIALSVLIFSGMILPELVTSRFLLDLHLLRASGLVQLLAILGLTVAAISSLRSSVATERCGGLLALCLLALPALQGVILAGPVLLAARRDDWKLTCLLSAPSIVVAFLTIELWPTPILIGLEIVATVGFIVLRHRRVRLNAPNLGASVAVVALVVMGNVYYTYNIHQAIFHKPEWEDARHVAEWARESTPADAMFLVPESVSSYFTAAMISSLSRRRIWVDWKRGGSVMWAPSYYEEWSQRMAEVASLRDLSAKLAYACKNAIDYVLIGPETKWSSISPSERPAYTNDHFQVFDTRQWCGRVK